LEGWPKEENLAQTVVTWSYFPGHGHKHADEMSVLFWAGGESWWTNVGYWPYGTSGREEAISWGGSNAPHLTNETRHSVRTTILRHYGWSEEMSVIHLERTGPGNYVVTRQVICLKPNIWIVVDSTSAQRSDLTHITWTTSHKVKVSEGNIKGAYELRVDGNPIRLAAFLLGSQGTEIKQSRGSVRPFAGWEVVNGIPQPSPTFIVQQAANNGWSAAIWMLKRDSSNVDNFTTLPYMKDWRGPEVWTLVLPLQSGQISLNRRYNQISQNGAHFAELGIESGPAINGKVAEIRASYNRAAIQYPEFRDLLTYRWKVTYGLLLLFLLQEVGYFAYKKVASRYCIPLRPVMICGWAGVGCWLFIVYFRP
jgi:hypothetical protein